MSNFRKVQQEIKNKLSDAPKIRTGYRCAAWGCPNAGSINDHGEKRRGLCGKHWNQPESEWQAITAKLHRTGERNYGDQPPRESAPAVKLMQGRMRGEPTGMVNGVTGAPL